MHTNVYARIVNIKSMKQQKRENTGLKVLILDIIIIIINKKNARD